MQDTAAGKNSVNLIALRQGDVVRLSGGGLVVIIENPGDGLWVYGVAVDGDGVTTEGEEPIFAQDIVEQLSEAEAQKFQKPIGGGAVKKIAPTPSLADQVAIALGDEIVSGKYKIGDGLRSENDLSKAFGVSRTVTREAISRLKAEGLVESRQGAGYFVISCKRHSAFKIDSEVAHDINKVLPIVEFRLGFEVEAAALAAERANARDLRVIKDAFGRMQRALNLHDLEAGIQADFDFHMSICKATHNIYFPDLFQTFQGFLFETLKISRENSARRLNSEAPAQTEHEAILAAIMGKDPDAARLAAKRHIWNTRSRLESARTSSESVERPLVRNEVKPAVK